MSTLFDPSSPLLWAIASVVIGVFVGFSQRARGPSKRRQRLIERLETSRRPIKARYWPGTSEPMPIGSESLSDIVAGGTLIDHVAVTPHAVLVICEQSRSGAPASEAIDSADAVRGLFEAVGHPAAANVFAVFISSQPAAMPFAFDEISRCYQIMSPAMLRHAHEWGEADWSLQEVEEISRCLRQMDQQIRQAAGQNTAA